MSGIIEAGLAGKKLVFIVGSPRSGTTWLRMIFAQSSNVATAPETRLFDKYLKSMFESWNEMRSYKTGLSNILNEQDVADWSRRFAALCLQKATCHDTYCKIIVEKTPGHVSYGKEILSLFPDSHFIHVIRDPRSVVLSINAASNTWAARWATGKIKDACAIWRNDVRKGRSIASLTPRYREVSYEQLHADAAGEIFRMFAWLAEPITAETAEEYVANCLLHKLRAAGAPEAPNSRSEDFFRRGETNSWRSELTPTEIAIVEQLTRSQMAELGYEPVSGRRAQLVAKAHLKAYRAANKVAKGARRAADRIKP